MPLFLLRALDRPDEARTADRPALDLTTDPAERTLLQERAASWPPMAHQGAGLPLSCCQ
ncbi:hypothetical protein [Streptomyces sp. NBC_01092]|uniref:hypothetical protein n=1 Tax=Streptomyces sp. NBC_01092 TaxID=2903748 RepID=UPI003869D459|nr:hypothetical protein OG254_46890 [Streptomyces sp. NBC_01092]